MTLDLFLTGLLIVSILTALFTEGIKRLMCDLKISYCSNVIAGAVSVVLAVVVGTGYIVVNNLAFAREYVVYIVALIGLSWLSAMIGYDKVIQALSQVRR